MFGVDDALIAAGIGAGGQLFGNIFSAQSASSSQQAANEANIASSREQMAFQERMANTSWQRGVSDMRAAGINPMLAVSKGGAPVPGGAMANSQPANFDFGRGISSAAQVLNMSLQNRLLEAQISATVNSARKTAVEALNLSSETPVRVAIRDATQSAINHAQGLRATTARSAGYLMDKVSSVVSGRMMRQFRSRKAASDFNKDFYSDIDR